MAGEAHGGSLGTPGGPPCCILGLVEAEVRPLLYVVHFNTVVQLGLSFSCAFHWPMMLRPTPPLSGARVAPSHRRPQGPPGVGRGTPGQGYQIQPWPGPSAPASAPVTDQAGNVTTIGYDSLGRKTGMADPDMGAWSYAYNPTGTLATQTDAKAQTTTFAYDALDRLTGKTYSTGYPTATFRYDEADVANGRGRRTTTMNANSGTRHAYDARGRQISTTATVLGLTESRVFEWTYDSGDRVQSMTYPALPGNAAREQVNYAYDAAWRQVGVGGLASYALSATYTALDQPLTLQLGNGLTQAWAYAAPMQRVQAITVGTGVLNRAYTYDPVGNVATIADNLVAQTQTFAYDARDRLTRAATAGGTAGSYDETDTYDPLGNLKTKGPTASPVASVYPVGGPGVARPHAPQAVGGRAQAYDANGNLTSDQGRLALTWGVENQPLGVTATDAQAAPQSWGEGNCDGTGQTRAAPGALAASGARPPSPAATTTSWP